MTEATPKPPAIDPSDAALSAFFAAEPSRRSLFWCGCQSICRIGTSLLYDLKVFGIDHIPSTGGAIIASNHQSNLDPVLLGVRLRRPVTYLAKVELFKNPIFGRLIRSLHAFPVRRGAGDVGAMKQSIQLLQAGYLLNFFPEGTRSRDGEIGAIQPGIALVVKRAGVPVIPAVIDGAFERAGRGRTRGRPAPILLQFGRPMSFEGMKGEQIVATLADTLRQMHIALREKRRDMERKAPCPSPGK